MPKKENHNITEADNGTASENMVTLKLVNGATFTFGGKIYGKGVLELVTPDIADKLMKTGFFERA